MLTALLNLIFPVNCGICNGGVDTANIYGICRKCIEEIEIINSNGCRFCGKPVNFAGSFCSSCLNKKSYIYKAYTACYYVDNIKNLIINFKYNGKRYLKRFLGELLLELYGIYLENEKIDLVVPVPLSAAKKKQRGFNQVEILSKFLSRKRDIPIGNKILKRVRDTKPQFELGRVDRFRNIQGAFRTTKKLYGKNILLIDDVATTGATIQNSAAALCEAGAEKIYALLIAHGK